MSAEPEPALVAIVTGGSGGIGSALVAILRERGYSVVPFDVRPALPAADDEFRTVDITRSAEVDRAVTEVVLRHGRLDAVVNAAGVLECYAVDDTPESVWDRVMAVNVKGAFLMSRAAIPHLRTAGGGSIVNISSVHALASVGRTAAYAASKGALVSLSRQMAVDYADDDIRVNSVVVGSVDTEMSKAHGAAIARDGVAIAPFPGRLGRVADPREVARAVAFLLSGDASFVNASAFVVDGGMLSRLM